MELKDLQKDRAKRVRKHSRHRFKDLRGTTCYVCHADKGHQVHHILPIRYGGSYGKYNGMSTCQGHCHSLLNRLCNHWCRHHKKNFEHLTLVQQTRELRKWLDKRLDSSKKISRMRELNEPAVDLLEGD